MTDKRETKQTLHSKTARDLTFAPSETGTGDSSERRLDSSTVTKMFVDDSLLLEVLDGGLQFLLL